MKEYNRIAMARWLLSVMILYYSLHHLFIEVHSVPNFIKSLFPAGQDRRNTAESSRTANWVTSRTDNRFHNKCERFKEAVRRAHSRRSGETPSTHLTVRRGRIFEDTFTATIGFSVSRWIGHWSITFSGEHGSGVGLTREWYTALMRSTVDREVQLFIASDGDRDAYTINPHKPTSDGTLRRLRFIGRVVGKAVYERQLLPIYFTRSMYKHILGKQVDCTDMEIEDPRYYQSLKYILENDITTVNEVLSEPLTWTVKVVEGGQTVERDLKPGGREIEVTNEQRDEYVTRVCEMKLHTVIKEQLDAFLAGFYDIVPNATLSIFNERELELVISGPPVIDVKDWKANTQYEGGYTARSRIIKWFWKSLESFNQEQLGRFLHYVTGSSKPPLRGFKYLDVNDVSSRKFVINKGDALMPHICHYELTLPSYFESKENLKQVLLTITESFSDGFARGG